MLDGKVVALTGGGSGIGEAAALRLARAGAAVLIGDVNEDAARGTAERINAAGGKAVGVALDVSDSASVAAFHRDALARFGRLDIGINNAGIAGSAATFVDLPEDQFDQVIAVNLKGVFLCMQQQLRQFEQSGGGVIVNTASVLGLIGIGGNYGYVAAKHGVVGLTKSAAIAYSAKNIRVNAVCPGVITTPLVSSGMEQEAAAASVALHPIGRLGKPEEVAEAILYLASDNSSFVTGSCLTIDGGWSAW